MAQIQNGKLGAYPPLRLVVEQDDAERIDQVFTHSFRVGREGDCDVIVQNSHVSRNHVEFDYKDDCWWIHDLESTNGVYLHGKKLTHAPVADNDELTLGKDGPRLTCHYLSGEEAASVYGQTPEDRMMRLVPARKKMIAFLVAALVLGGGGFLFGQREMGQYERIREEADDHFIQIRTADMAIAQVYAERAKTDRLVTAQRLISLEAERKNHFEAYSRNLIQLGLYQSLDEQEQQIYNTARLYNENELTIPPAFVEEVRQTIQNYWLDEHRAAYEEALDRARSLDYSRFILKSLNEFGLTEEFFYLPLTVSGFDPEKQVVRDSGDDLAGVWQLSIPGAMHYGLKTEPDKASKAFSISDERYNFGKSTRAAVAYLHDIYRAEAMASGLTTLALFLQYEQETIDDDPVSRRAILEDLSRDVRAQSIWYIRQHYPELISDTVYEVVVRIFAASVIGQDPSLFGLDVTTPTLSNTFKSFR